MKPDIHPQYHTEAKVQCSCGNTWKTGSTLPEIEVEVCSNCHPFYTGKEKVLDTRGRIDKFQKRMSKAQPVVAKKPRAKKATA